jgi:DNA-binding transcriptional LysR family regulator
VSDLDLQLLRRFVVLAEELHFSRAAGRLFMAQQALSRDIRRLERQAGMRLLERTTRSVALTPAGRVLLSRAPALLALHDATMRQLRGVAGSLTVDVVGAGLTPARVLAEARMRDPDTEFFARFHTGEEAAVPHLLAERLDVTFGRDPSLARGLRQRPIRHEPIGVLLPEHHPLARLEAVPLEALRGAEPCFRSGDHATPGWEHALLQLLGPLGVHPIAAHPHVSGPDELTRHLYDRDAPVITMTTQPAVPGAVLKRLVRPSALFPWAMIWRSDVDHPGLRILNAVLDDIIDRENWLSLPDDAWLPEPEATRMTRLQATG